MTGSPSVYDSATLSMTPGVNNCYSNDFSYWLKRDAFSLNRFQEVLFPPPEQKSFPRALKPDRHHAALSKGVGRFFGSVHLAHLSPAPAELPAATSTTTAAQQRRRQQQQQEGCLNTKMRSSTPEGRLFLKFFVGGEK